MIIWYFFVIFDHQNTIILVNHLSKNMKKTTFGPKKWPPGPKNALKSLYRFTLYLRKRPQKAVPDPKNPFRPPPTGPKTTLRTSKMGPKTTLRTSKMGPKTTFGTLKTGLLGPGGLRRLVWYSGVRIGGAEAGYLQSSFLDLVSVPKLKIIFSGHNLKKFANSPHLEGGEFRPSARGVQGTRSRPPGTPPPQTGVARRVAQQQNKGPRSQRSAVRS